MEQRTEVKIIEVDFKCPKCDAGYLRHTGLVLMTYPAQYPHACNNPNCDYIATFQFQYPYIKHEGTSQSNTDSTPECSSRMA